MAARDVPDKCPHGHRMWWFPRWRNRLVGPWGICDCPRVRDTDPCNVVWGWNEDRHVIFACPAFPQGKLVLLLRTFAEEDGYSRFEKDS